jgi:isoprenylcysteine carboxyl methyltransferase (ICMT) family protein YpbQ
MIKFRMEFLCQRHRQFDLLAAVITVRNSLPHARQIIAEGILAYGQRNDTRLIRHILNVQ